MTIIENILDDNQYFKAKYPKKQIVIHHTAGSGNAKNVIHGWNFNQVEVGTAFVIDSEGIVFKAFDPDFWAYHLGLKTPNNVPLNRGSVGIEVCNWGQLIKKDGKFLNYINKEVPADQVVQIEKFRGFEYYHKYNSKQIESLRQLLLMLGEKYNIDLSYNQDIFGICQRALNGDNGLFTHVSYREDKNDMSPQPDLINMLKTLKK